MSNFLKHFWFDLVFAAFAYTFVFYATGSSWVAVQTAIFLSILEISVSFDNAVVNAKKIEKMNTFWRIAFFFCVITPLPANVPNGCPSVSALLITS